MAKKKQEEKLPQTNEELQNALPAGVRLLHTLQGHEAVVYGLAFDPGGETLASGSRDKSCKLWDPKSGELLRTFQGHKDWIRSVAFDPQGGVLATASDDRTVKLWEAQTGKLLDTLTGHKSFVWSVAFDRQGEVLASGGWDNTVKLWDPQRGKLLRTLEGFTAEFNGVAFDPHGKMLASGSRDNTVRLWEVRTGKLLHTLAGHKNAVVSVAFFPHGETLASASDDGTVKIWDTPSGKLLRTLERHTGKVEMVVASPDSSLLASKSRDHTIILWSCDTWEPVAVIPEPSYPSDPICALAFHPTLPLLASAGSAPGTADDQRSRLIHLWELDYDVLAGRHPKGAAVAGAVHHTTAKIVLVGDHSVGKSALGYRLIHSRFEKQESTHGQQFWVFPALGKRRADGTDCEAILWDFAGQPDYRLVHALFVDNADLALVLFDASDLRDPLHGVDFWLKQLQAEHLHCPIILVAAQTDRGTCSLTPEELRAFCQRKGIAGPITTSAASGVGIEELIERMKALIPWDDKPATVTTTTFKRIKDYVLGLKEEKLNGDKSNRQTIVTPEELRARMQATDAAWQFTDAEMLTAVGHLENYGYVKRLRTSKGDLRILLQPERLNNLASSFVLEARRNIKGLGALEEKRLLLGGYDFPELKDLNASEREMLLDSAALLFLEHNVCFRETDLLMEPYLVFPELINLKKPLEDDAATEDGAAYTVSGPTENVFASLVVLLGYTHTFTRTAQWHNNARYEVGHGLVCGFRQEGERDGELDFVFCFATRVGVPVRTLFQGLFESFLEQRKLTVMRYEAVRCTRPQCGQLLDRSVVRQRLTEGKAFAFCNECGKRLTLTKPVQLSRAVHADVVTQRQAAEQRTVFEQALFRVRAYIAEQKRKPPECFISYAWGVPEHERWVEKRLVTDLQKAGLQIVFDRKDNQHGDSLTRFISRIPYCDSVVVVGTPLYFQKFENRVSSAGSVVAAEVRLISQRLIATEEDHRSVKTLLLAGEKKTSLPPLMWDGIHADFRDDSRYFLAAFDLILSLYQLSPNDPAVADLRQSLRGPEFR